jgi:hypothetical protein
MRSIDDCIMVCCHYEMCTVQSPPRLSLRKEIPCFVRQATLVGSFVEMANIYYLRLQTLFMRRVPGSQIPLVLNL